MESSQVQGQHIPFPQAQSGIEQEGMSSMSVTPDMGGPQMGFPMQDPGAAPQMQGPMMPAMTNPPPMAAPPAMMSAPHHYYVPHASSQKPFIGNLTYMQVINLTHMLLVAPFLAYVGYQGRQGQVPRAAFNVMLGVAVLVFLFHGYRFTMDPPAMMMMN